MKPYADYTRSERCAEYAALQEQYDVIYGSWPQSYDEVVLVVDQNNEVSDLVLYTLGLRTEEELTSLRRTASTARSTCATMAS